MNISNRQIHVIFAHNALEIKVVGHRVVPFSHKVPSISLIRVEL